VLVIDGLINQPVQLGTLLVRAIVGGCYGAIFGTGAGTVASLLVVPVVTMWLRAAGVQGRSVAWVQRRTQLLTMTITALVAYCTGFALADSSARLGSVLLFGVPGVIAIAYSACAARSLVVDNPRGASARFIDALYR
jgi:hypothetical protein